MEAEAQRRVGRKSNGSYSLYASGALLKQGAEWNDALNQSLPTGGNAFFPKGVYHYKTLEEMDNHRQQCLVEGMAKVLCEKRKGSVHG